MSFLYVCHYEVKIRRTKAYGNASSCLLKAVRANHKMTKLPAHHQSALYSSCTSTAKLRSACAEFCLMQKIH